MRPCVARCKGTSCAPPRTKSARWPAPKVTHISSPPLAAPQAYSNPLGWPPVVRSAPPRHLASGKETPKAHARAGSFCLRTMLGLSALRVGRPLSGLKGKNCGPNSRVMFTLRTGGCSLTWSYGRSRPQILRSCSRSGYTVSRLRGQRQWLNALPLPLAGGHPGSDAIGSQPFVRIVKRHSPCLKVRKTAWLRSAGQASR